MIAARLTKEQEMKKTMTNLLASVVYCMTFFTAMPTQAAVAIPETSSFYLHWLGFNGSEAHGMLTIDNALFPNPSNDIVFLTPRSESGILDFSLSVFDAISGITSAYQSADFDYLLWKSVVKLDLSQELVGQETGNGGWGTEFVNGDTGEFSLLAKWDSDAPTTYGPFQIAMLNDEGFGNSMTLVSFRPVPLPTAFWLFGSSLFGFIAISRKKPEAQLI